MISRLNKKNEAAFFSGMNPGIRAFGIIFCFLFVFSGDLAAKEIVLLNRTKKGEGATEEQAKQIYDSFVKAMSALENVEVRTKDGCEKPCESPAYIISSELLVQPPFITVYFRVINRKKGLAANVQRIRLKDAKFQDMVDLLNPQYVKSFFDFLDSGAYSGTKVIEK